MEILNKIKNSSTNSLLFIFFNCLSNSSSFLFSFPSSFIIDNNYHNYHKYLYYLFFNYKSYFFDFSLSLLFIIK